jgi:hypothetical protein
MVAVVEVSQISCWASLLQGIQMIAASDSQKVTTVVEAAAMVEVTIADLRMELTIQKSPDCFIVSSRRMLLACLAGFARRLIQVIMRTRITQKAGFASRLLQKIGFLLRQVAVVRKLKSLPQVAEIVAGADRKCFERVEIARKTQFQIAIVATVESFLQSL